MLQPLGGEASSVITAVSSEFASSPSLGLPSTSSAHQHPSRGESRLVSQSLPLSPPCAQPRPAPANITGATTPTSSSPSSSSPSLASASTLSPSLSYFPPSSSAFHFPSSDTRLRRCLFSCAPLLLPTLDSAVVVIAVVILRVSVEATLNRHRGSR